MTQSFLENQTLVFVCMLLAIFRVGLEVYQVDLKQLPLSKKYPVFGAQMHKFGFYMSVGYIILFAPEILLS